MAPATLANLFSLCGDSVWDSSLSWNTDHPLLTECFQSTVLTWIPTLFMLLCAPLQFLSRKKNISLTPEANAEVDARAVRSWTPFWTPWVAWKSLAIAVLQAANIIKLLNDVINYRQYGVARAHIVGTIIEIIGLCLSLAYLLNERRRRRHTSGTQFFYWLLLLIAHALRFYTTTRSSRGSRLDYILEVIMFVAAILGFIAQLFADNYGRRTYHGDDERECPVAHVSFLSNITFAWLSGLMLRGWRRPLVEKDLWTPLEENRTDFNVINFERAWQREVDQSRRKAGNRLPSVFRAAYQIIAGTFWSGVVFMLLDVVFTFLSPQILKLLIGFVANSAEYQWHGFLYTVALLLVAIAQSLCQNQYYNASYITGMNLRSAIMATVYRKALRVSNDARNQATVGEMVNLISIDAQRFLDFMGFVYMLLNAPIIVIVAIIFLWNELGLAVLGGLAVLILLLPLNIYAGAKQRVYLTAQMERKDQRIRSMSEILSGIKVLKLYAWEIPFITRISKVRAEEIRLLLSANYVMALMNFFFQLMPFLIALGSFAMYVLLSPSNILTAQKAFVSLALFNILRVPLGTLPFVITMMVQFRISLRRVNRFLSSDELDLNSVKRAPLSAADRDGMSVIIQDGTFSWTKKPDQQPALRDINLAIPRGKLVAIVGQVGCGKSSICSAILGQMEKLKGSVEVRGSVAYVPQQAWIQNMTLRDNIMFTQPATAGKTLDERAYRKVLSACALDQDLEMMPAGDETEIGEKGMNLSGGQKQRVSLARATFSNTDVIVLDDPLSAVDSHVAKHIFENLLSNDQGLLRHKTRILVTHNISFLPRVDQIVVMDDGVVTEAGSYHQLLDKGGAFADFLRAYLVDNGVDGETNGEDGKASEDEDGDEVNSETDSETRRVKQEILSKLGASTTPATPSATGTTSPHHRTSVASSLKRRRSRRRSSSSTGGKKVRQPTGGSVATVESKLRARRASGRDLRREAGKLMTVEESATGNVEFGVYLTYFKYMRWDLTILIVILYFIWNGLNVFNSIWLSEWSNDADRFASPAQANSVSNRNYRLGVYGIIGAMQGIFIIVSTYVFAYASMRAAAKLHSNMLERVMHAPMSFFDTTPSGRLLNRFSKDVDSLDTNVPANLRMFFTTFCVVLSMVFTICYSTPLFLVMLIPLGLLYFIAQRFYVCSSRQLRRLESVMRSPIYSLFTESVTGQAVIRAAQQERRFIAENERRIDLTNMAYYPYIQSQRWLNLGLTAVGALAVFSASLFAVFARESGIASGIVGLAISNALAITGPLNWMVRQTSELETNIVSAERMKEYTEIVQEPPWELPSDDANVPKEWPQHGAVDFNDYQTRYRAGLDLVLRGITAHIEPSEKVGIVGRTGAGKSSLTLALFRIIEPAGGSIVIDGVDIVKIGLHKLRSRLTIIPQDPILFSGTLRFNLDPGEQHTDDALWLALEQAHLKQWATATSQKLEFAVAEEGQNLSVGQRQLVCLARALLRKTRILVLDEATAAVDMETDELIQESITREFKDSTVLTIAHRLNTILDYDRVMVLANGRIKEFDSPKNLLATLPANGTNGNGKGGEPSEFALLARDANITQERIAALGLADKNGNNGAINVGGLLNTTGEPSDIDTVHAAAAAAATGSAAAAVLAAAPHVDADRNVTENVGPVNFASQPTPPSNDNAYVGDQNADYAVGTDMGDEQQLISHGAEDVGAFNFATQQSLGNNNGDSFAERNVGDYRQVDNERHLADDNATNAGYAVEAENGGEQHLASHDAENVGLLNFATQQSFDNNNSDSFADRNIGDKVQIDDERYPADENAENAENAGPVNFARQQSPRSDVDDYVDTSQNVDSVQRDDDDERLVTREDDERRDDSSERSDDEEGLATSFIGKTLE